MFYKIYLTKVILTGIAISGLEVPLTVGQQSPTLTCRTNILVSSIEWRDQSFVLASATNKTVLEYTIPERYVLDIYYGQQYICEAVATSNDGATITYIEIQVVGNYHASNSSMELSEYTPFN